MTRAILVVIALAGCTKRTAAPADGAAATEEESDAIAAACVPATPATADEVVTLRGIVAVPPDRDAVVAPAVAGRVHEVLVHAGDRVTAGQVIATIEAPDVQAVVGESGAAAATARAELVAADAALARAQHLVERGISPRRDLEDAQTRRATAAAAVAAAGARVTLGERQRANGRVTAPLGGVVLRVTRRAGELVDGTAGTPIVEIADPDLLELRADVPAASLVRLGGATTGEIMIDAAPEHPLVATVTYLSPAVDPATGLGELRAKITVAPALNLAIGLAGTLTVHRGPAVAGASVPVAAVRRSATGSEEVVVCKPDEHGLVAAVTPVTTGVRSGGRVTIVTGLAPGDQVATAHVIGIDDGAPLASGPAR